MMFHLHLFVLLFLLSISNIEAIESFVTIGETGTEFDPFEEDILLLAIYFFSNYNECMYACHSNYFCRVFDYDSASLRCRLFEGDVTTTGFIITSNSSTSLAGQIEFYPELFSAYGYSCSACLDNRYLTCVNSTCDCLQHTYWTGSICASQNLRGGECFSSNQCRTDLNHTCLQFFQCGPASLLVGETVFGNADGSAGNSSTSLNTPWGISVNAENSILIADAYNGRVVIVRLNSSDNATIVGEGGQLDMPSKAIYDIAISSNLYVLDARGDCMMVWLNTSTTGVNLFGTRGSNLNQFNVPASFYLSSNKSFYIADQNNHRIVLWLWNASSGIVIAGQTNVIGNDTFHLNTPTDVFVDEKLGQMYVADFNNHRIVRYTFGSLNGTVVAGGNGQGTRRNQFNGPISVYVSKKTNVLYIVDQMNNRVQKWSIGDSQGVTIAGDPNGSSGMSNLLLNDPNSLSLDAEETYLFVCERNSYRIKMFELI